MDLEEELADARSPSSFLERDGNLGPVDDLDTVSRPRPATGPEESESLWRRWRLTTPALAYCTTRLGFVLIALIGDAIFGGVVKNTNLSHEFANWDGQWYIRVATLGYPNHVVHGQTTLGFFPLYPMAMWIVSHVLLCSYVVSGLGLALVGGFVATLLVQQLVTEWWGPDVARKAVWVFCIFPGSIVFTMDYSECLTIPLVAGCLLAMQHRKWLLAGILAAIATGSNAAALTIVPACAVVSLVQLWRYGWSNRDARRSLLAPLLSPLGAIGFAIFLKLWTGSALADYAAQTGGWRSSTTVFAVPRMAINLVHEITSPAHLSAINLNDIVGLLGAAFLVFGLIFLWRDRFSIPIGVWVFVLGMSFLMVTDYPGPPPNPRLLITAFPVVLVYAKELQGRAYTRLLWGLGLALVVFSMLTYVGYVLRP